MNKSDVLEGVRSLAARQEISEADVVAAYQAGRGQGVIMEPARRLAISDILYYIGGAIVFLGIVVFVGQRWNTLPAAAQIIATLGSGVAAYVVGILLTARRSTSRLAHAFYLISALVLPVGLAVTFHKAGYDIGSLSIQTLMAALLFVLYVASLFMLRLVIFSTFSVVFGTVLFFSLTSWLVGPAPQFRTWHFFEYRILLAGLSFILLGHSVRAAAHRVLTGPLYTVGLVAFLGSALALGGWKPNQNLFWESIFPGVAFVIIFLSIRLKSRSFLVWGALFLMGYIVKITAEYFPNSLGWPLALVIVGGALIAIGYATFYLHRRYLRRAA